MTEFDPEPMPNMEEVIHRKSGHKLVNSGVTFCRLMREVLTNVPNVDSFFDHMWIFIETWEANMTSLCQVVDRLRSA